MSFSTLFSFHSFAGNKPPFISNVALSPIDVTILSNTLNSITFSFAPPTGTVTSYTPYVNGVAGTGSGTPASYTITGLTAGTTYSIVMYASMICYGGVSNFLPTSVTGCALWLDAADTTTITKIGSNVTQWNDKSGNGNNATQSNSASQPTSGVSTQNGYNVITFAGTTKYMSYGTTNVSPSTMTVFCIYNNNTFNPYGEPVEVGPFSFFYPAPSSNVGIGRKGATDEILSSWSTNGLTTSQYVLYTGTVSVSTNTVCNLFFNGTQVGTSNVSSSGGISSYNVGALTGSTTGNIGEVIVFNSVLTATNRRQIEGYLAWKWGIRTSFSTTHPFYSVSALTNAYSVFSPKSISGLNVWWDGSDPNGTDVAPVNGATISTWVDKSGNGYNATASVAGTYSSSPVGVNFGTTGYYTTNYPANPTNESCFIVFNKSSNNQMMMIGANSGGREVAMQTGTIFGIVNSGIAWGATMTAGSATGVSHIGEAFVSGGTSTSITFNGGITLTGPTAVPAFTSGVLTNLGREGSFLQYIGYIQEILFYNSVLTLSQRQQVEGYLAWKWGVQTNLPAAHPYYSTTGLASVASVGPAAISYTSVGSVVKSLSTVANLPVFTNYNSVTTNGLYKIYAYTTVGSYSNAITMTGVSNLVIQIFAVGGGGSGGCDQAGGGGAGGLLQSSITMNGSDTVSLTVGGGGVAIVSPNRSVSGSPTTVSFTTNTGNNITCYGGGGGANYIYAANLNSAGTAVTCGSGGGGSGYNSYAAGAGTAGQGNSGGAYGGQGVNGGGGGAGAVGGAGLGSSSGGGGVGVQINTSLLTYFAGSTYANYWWAGGGGGGGSLNNIYAGNGGKGGGGGGSSNSYTGGLGDINGINTASNGGQGFGQNGGAAGANTGGGGGGADQAGGDLGGAGGSGIILIAVPT